MPLSKEEIRRRKRATPVTGGLEKGLAEARRAVDTAIRQASGVGRSVESSAREHIGNLDKTQRDTLNAISNFVNPPKQKPKARRAARTTTKSTGRTKRPSGVRAKRTSSSSIADVGTAVARVKRRRKYPAPTFTGSTKRTRQVSRVQARSGGTRAEAAAKAKEIRKDRRK